MADRLNWQIIIRGAGPSFSHESTDADRLARDLVDRLTRNGHTIKVAVFSQLGKQSPLTTHPLTPPRPSPTAQPRPPANGSR